jgi:hypothetical protein
MTQKPSWLKRFGSIEPGWIVRATPPRPRRGGRTDGSAPGGTNPAKGAGHKEATMNRTLALATALCALAAGTASAQIVQEKPFEQSFVLGGNAYVNQWDQSRLTIAAAANPAQVVATFDALDVIESQEIAAPYIYLVTASGVEVLDVSAPASPRLIATILPAAGHQPGWIKVIGTHAYETEYGNGWLLRSFDVSVPASPTFLGQRVLATGGSSSGGQVSAIDASHIAVGMYTSGPQVLDVSNPANPTLTSTVPAGGCGGQIAKDHRLYLWCGLTSSTSRVVVYDLSNPALPGLVGTLTVPRASYDPMLLALAVRNGRTYLFGEVLVNDEEDLAIVDVTAPSSPQLASMLRLASGGADYQALDVDVVGTTAWVACVLPPHWPIVYYFFVAEVDIADPAHPVLRAIRAVPRLP